MSNLNAGRPSKSNTNKSLSLDDLVENEKTKRVNFDLSESQHRKLKEYADFLINVPSTDTPRIQECHILVGHIICQLVEEKYFDL